MQKVSTGQPQSFWHSRRSFIYSLALVSVGGRVLAAEGSYGEHHPFIGRAAAAVTMNVWFDFQCPFCKLFWSNTIPKLKTNYVENGKLKIIFSDYPFLGDDSQAAAMIGREVWHSYPAAYFDWTNAMFNAQDEENAGFGNAQSVLKLTMSLPKIDGAKFTDELKKNLRKNLDEIMLDMNEAKAAGVTGTPAYMLGGQLFSGAASYEKVSAKVDSLLGPEHKPT